MRIKRMLSFILSFIMVISFGVTAYAEDIYAGSLKYSNIATYINHFPIPSYNFNGETYICLETLGTYGFDLIWNDNDKTKCAVRNGETEITPCQTFMPRSDQVGKEYQKIYECDVKVYMGDHDKLLKWYKDMDGYLYINANELSYFGKVDWAPEVNAVKVWIGDGLKMDESMFPLKPDPYPIKYYDYLEYDDKISWNAYSAGGEVIFIMAFVDGAGEGYIICPGSVYFTVYDSAGNIIGTHSEYFTPDDYSVYQYFLGLTDNKLSTYFWLDGLGKMPDGKAYVRADVTAGGYTFTAESSVEAIY